MILILWIAPKDVCVCLCVFVCVCLCVCVHVYVCVLRMIAYRWQLSVNTTSASWCFSHHIVWAELVPVHQWSLGARVYTASRGAVFRLVQHGEVRDPLHHGVVLISVENQTRSLSLISHLQSPLTQRIVLRRLVLLVRMVLCNEAAVHRLLCLVILSRGLHPSLSSLPPLNGLIGEGRVSQICSQQNARRWLVVWYQDGTVVVCRIVQINFWWWRAQHSAPPRHFLIRPRASCLYRLPSSTGHHLWWPQLVMVFVNAGHHQNPVSTGIEPGWQWSRVVLLAEITRQLDTSVVGELDFVCSFHSGQCCSHAYPSTPTPSASAQLPYQLCHGACVLVGL